MQLVPFWIASERNFEQCSPSPSATAATGHATPRKSQSAQLSSLDLEDYNLHRRLKLPVACKSTLASLSLSTMATAKAPLILSSPDILGGTPVFAGTRVPVQTLIEYLEGGETIDDFLQGFPTVTRDQVIAFLEEAKARMLAKAS